MVNRILVKEAFNFIKKNKKTFISQILIIILGISFFIGMKVAVVDLHNIMVNYIEESNMYDYSINVEYGIEKKI
ncbi:MAG: hypothetical protein E7262_03035 [Lachnospiraceae bacterium]|nr:hypothetical protein [Lachnospiraceae bacterium]